MKTYIAISLLFLSACASNDTLETYENGARAEAYCHPNTVEQNYEYTIYSSDKKEKKNKTKVTTTCQPVQTETDFERANREQRR